MPAIRNGGGSQRVKIKWDWAGGVRDWFELREKDGEEHMAPKSGTHVTFIPRCVCGLVGM